MIVPVLAVSQVDQERFAVLAAAVTAVQTMSDSLYYNGWAAPLAVGGGLTEQ